MSQSFILRNQVEAISRSVSRLKEIRERERGESEESKAVCVGHARVCVPAPAGECTSIRSGDVYGCRDHLHPSSTAACGCGGKLHDHGAG